VPTVYKYGSSTIYTNQYAVTEQSKEVNEMMVPGIFFKYDIEPILLSVQEERDGFFRFLFKLANVLSGVLVAAHWGATLTEWVREVVGKRRRSSGGEGMLGKKGGYTD
jgi:hypothetical protein